MRQSAGIILVNFKTKNVLCLRSYNNWDFPKGGLDEGETHLAAAIRELEEETGYNESDIHLMSAPPVSTTYGSGKNAKTATFYFAILTNTEKSPILPVNPEIGKPEHDEWRWVSLHQLYDFVPARLKNVAEKTQFLFEE